MHPFRHERRDDGDALNSLRAIIPRPLRQALRRTHRAWAFRNAFGAIQRRLATSREMPDSLMEELIYGWNNEGWSAKPQLLAYLLREYGTFGGTMLECGSGLSTIVMALVARRTGASVISLEHDPEWFDRLRRRLQSLHLPDSGLRLAPLRNHGGYDWYDVGDDVLGTRPIDLVLCDGPPSGTPGGRYGLWPQMVARLTAGARIIVDDSHRAEEAAMISRWQAEAGGRIRLEATHTTFAVLRVC